MKYSLSPREIPRAKPEGFPKGTGYISSYILTQVTIQTFSLTTPALTFLEINIGRVDSQGIRLYFIVYPDPKYNTDILTYNSSIDLPGDQYWKS